ncbi:MAG: molybdate ABC transporter substrate-binding protein [Acidobacteriota bacterium]
MIRHAAILACSILLLAAPPARTAKPELAVAAAANLTQVFRLVGPAFEAASGIHPVFSFGSTAQLTRQIENGAPWDLIAAADSAHVGQLDRQGLLTPGSRAIYATGILALWIPPGSRARIARPGDLPDPSVRIVALANPDLAPYGLAAREALQHLGIWVKVQPKVVYADNISMAKQYGATGNADAVFTAYSLLLDQKGQVIPISESLHRPLTQALGIVAASKNQAAARRFADFLLTGEGHQILLRHGYR